MWRNAESRQNAEEPWDASRHAAGRADPVSQHALSSRPDIQLSMRSRVVASAFRAISAFHLPRVAAGARTPRPPLFQTGFQDQQNWQDSPSRPRHWGVGTSKAILFIPQILSSCPRRHGDRLRAHLFGCGAKDKPRGRRNPEANATASQDEWIKGGEVKTGVCPHPRRKPRPWSEAALRTPG